MESLPEHAILSILTNLCISDALNAALTCKRWLQCFYLPYLWRNVNFNFVNGEQDRKQLRCVDLHGSDIRQLLVRIDQSVAINRDLAVELLLRFTAAELGERQLECVRIIFIGENPLFYGGQEFVHTLHVLFSQPPESLTVKRKFRSVDLSQLPIMYTDEVFYALSQYNSDSLQFLDIQNKQLVCKISKDCVKTVVKRCKNLTDLRLFHSSMSDDVLLEFAKTDRLPLRHISILCRRYEKYNATDLSEDAWNQLKTSCPRLQVTLKFDHACPLWKVREIMKPSIPVYNLFLETYTMIFEELQIATDMYAKILHKVVIQTQPSDQFDQSLIDLATKAPQLSSLHVMCPVSEQCIAQLLELLPKLTQPCGEYTLKHDIEPHPWVSDDVMDEIRDHWK